MIKRGPNWSCWRSRNTRCLRFASSFCHLSNPPVWNRLMFLGFLTCPSASTIRHDTSQWARLVLLWLWYLSYGMTHGSLEVKLPTVWTDDEQRWEWSQKRREEQSRGKERRSEEIREDQRRSEKIRQDQRRSEKIREGKTRSEKIREDQRRSVKTKEDHRRSQKTKEDHRRSQ